MNRKDIQAGGEYAVKLDYSLSAHASPGDYTERDIAKAKVIKVHEKDPTTFPENRYAEKNRVVEVEVIEDFQSGKYARERIQFIPVRRVICTFEDYLAARVERRRMEARWAREREERTTMLTDKVARLDELQEKLGLTEGHFDATVYGDGSFGFKFVDYGGEGIDNAITLLERLANAESEVLYLSTGEEQS